MLRRVRVQISRVLFFIRNMRATGKMNEIAPCRYQEYYIAGLEANQFDEMYELYQTISGGQTLGYWHRKLIKLRGNKLCGIIMDKNRRILGFQLHHFKKRELPKGILYVEYGCLLPEVRGKSLSTALRKYTAKHFLLQGIKGLSAHTHKENYPALNAAKSIGYAITDEKPNAKGYLTLYLDLRKFCDLVNT